MQWAIRPLQARPESVICADPAGEYQIATGSQEADIQMAASLEGLGRLDQFSHRLLAVSVPHPGLTE